MFETVTGKSLTVLSERHYPKCYRCLHSLLMAQCLTITSTVSMADVFVGMNDLWKNHTALLCHPATLSFRRFMQFILIF